MLTATEKAQTIRETVLEHARKNPHIKGTGAWIGGPDTLSVHYIDLETFGALAGMIQAMNPETKVNCSIEGDLYSIRETIKPFDDSFVSARVTYFSSKYNKRGER